MMISDTLLSIFSGPDCLNVYSLVYLGAHLYQSALSHKLISFEQSCIVLLARPYKQTLQ